MFLSRLNNHSLFHILLSTILKKLQLTVFQFKGMFSPILFDHSSHRASSFFGQHITNLYEVISLVIQFQYALRMQVLAAIMDSFKVIGTKIHLCLNGILKCHGQEFILVPRIKLLLFDIPVEELIPVIGPNKNQKHDQQKEAKLHIQFLLKTKFDLDLMYFTPKFPHLSLHPLHFSLLFFQNNSSPCIFVAFNPSSLNLLP